MDNGDGSSSARMSIHKCDPSASSANLTSSDNALLPECAPKESKDEAVLASIGTAGSAAAASAAAISSSSPPHPFFSFFSSVQTHLESLLPILSTLQSLRRAIADPVEADERAQLHEAREALQLIQAQLVRAPQSKQEMQSRLDELQEEIRNKEGRLESKGNRRRMEDCDRQLLRTQLALREGELSVGQLAVMLANGAISCRSARNALLTGEIPADILQLQQRWQLRACALLEQLAGWITNAEIQPPPDVISAYASAGLFVALKSLLKHFESDCVLEIRGNPYLSGIAAEPGQHATSLTPLLHFIQFGLDPTLFSDVHTQSALQMARQHAKANPLPNFHEGDSQRLQSMSDSDWLPNLAVESAAQQIAASWEEEGQRRNRLHTQFMHAVVFVWRSHSSAVRSLLLEAAPDQLIPDLANICAEYLDLEPAEKRR